MCRCRICYADVSIIGETGFNAVASMVLVFGDIFVSVAGSTEESDVPNVIGKSKKGSFYCLRWRLPLAGCLQYSVSGATLTQKQISLVSRVELVWSITLLSLLRVRFRCSKAKHSSRKTRVTDPPLFILYRRENESNPT